ncbi:otopetrin [Clonorchis sinensis]|uniref:Otopetrin n=1 Tax=Clonorchis sinensis TaxID=79923 RepID=G7YPF7_CLOSI|nr:otopetrin [Clonorchis sinensis]
MPNNLDSEPSRSTISSMGSHIISSAQHRSHNVKTSRIKMKNRRRLQRSHRRLEKEMLKNSTHPAPFSSVRINDKKGSMKANFLLIFAILQCICGFVFPICDAFALTDNWSQFAINHKYYMEVFVMSEYVGAIIFLAYLQLLIHCYTDPEEKKVYEGLSTRMSTESWQRKQSVEVNSPVVLPLRTMEDTHNDCHNVNRQAQPMRTEDQCAKPRKLNNCFGLFQWNRGKTASNYPPKLSWHKEGMNLYMRLGAVGFGLGVMIHEGFNLSSAWELEMPYCHSKLWIPQHLLRLVWLLWQTYFIFKYHKVILHVHRFIVRMAFYHLAVVNICHWLRVVISEIAEMLKHIEDGSSTKNDQLYHTLLSVSLFNDAELKDHVHHVETDNNLHNISNFVTGAIPMLTDPSFNPNRNKTRNCNSHMGQTLKPFLFPMAIEYSLVTGTLFYKMLQRVARYNADLLPPVLTPNSACQNPRTPSFSLPSTPRDLHDIMPSGTISNNLKPPEYICTKHAKYRQLLGCIVYLPPESSEETEPHGAESENAAQSPLKAQPFRSNRHLAANYCHRSHTGLFLGLMLFIASVIGIISSVSNKRITLLNFIPHIYQYSKIIMLSVSMIACLLAIVQTHQMKFRRTKTGETFEYNLLGLGLVGCLTYHMLLFVPALEWIVHVMLYQSQVTLLDNHNAGHVGLSTPGSEKWAAVAILYIVKSTLEILQAVSQFFFIVEASRRGPCCKKQALIKPGRSAIVFLLITNLALWLINTCEIRQAEHQLRLHREYYGLRTWSVITCCFIPLIIFFRFHSTICLAQVWSTLYELRRS